MKSKPKHPHIVKKRSTHFLSAVRLLANTEPKILDSTISYGNGHMPALRLSVVRLRLFVFQRTIKTCPSPHSFPLQRTRNSSIDGIPHALIVTSFIFANIIKFDQLSKFLFVEPMGIEPTTVCLQGNLATLDHATPYISIFCAPVGNRTRSRGLRVR